MTADGAREAVAFVIHEWMRPEYDTAAWPENQPARYVAFVRERADRLLAALSAAGYTVVKAEDLP